MVDLDYEELLSIAKELRIRLVNMQLTGITQIKRDSMTEIQARKLKIVQEENQDCSACKLKISGCKSLVFGSGSSGASVIWVGEGPGSEEDDLGLPFVGESGQLLSKMMEAMVHEAYKRLKDPNHPGGIDFEAMLKAHVFKRENTYITNIVKHRPPGNRKPEPDEISACIPILKDQIAALSDTAQVIVCLGATAGQSLLQTNTAVGQLRGKWHEYRATSSKTLPVMVTYHPAYLLPGRNPDAKGLVWNDLKLVIGKVIGK